MSTPEVAQPVPPQEALEWEAAQRGRSGLSGIVAAVFTILGGIASGLVFADFPHVVAIDALKESVGDGVAGAPGLKASQIIFYNDHAVELILVSLALAIGSAAMAPILGFMYRATAARTPKLPRMALYSAMIGPILVAVGTIALQVATSVKASDFAGAADQSTAAAHDALTGGVLLGATLLRQLGVLVVGLAFVLISLHAMRVGLLTKFLGILGIIAGVLFVVPLGGQLPVVQCFFLLTLGFLVMRRWPGTIPRAWVGRILSRGAIGAWEQSDDDLPPLVHSIRGKLFALGDDVGFVPGHGETSTMGRERRENPFVGEEAVIRAGHLARLGRIAVGFR